MAYLSWPRKAKQDHGQPCTSFKLDIPFLFKGETWNPLGGTKRCKWVIAWNGRCSINTFENDMTLVNADRPTNLGSSCSDYVVLPRSLFYRRWKGLINTHTQPTKTFVTSKSCMEDLYSRHLVTPHFASWSSSKILYVEKPRKTELEQVELSSKVFKSHSSRPTR